MESSLIKILAVVAVLMTAFVFALWRHKKGSAKDVRLLGQTGTANTDINPTGSIIIDGELWPARSSDGRKIPPSTRVRVVGFQETTALVETCD